MGILNTFNTGKNGLKVHGTRLEVHAQNIANIDTPNYQRKIPVLMAREDISFHGLLNNMKETVFATGAIPHTSGGVAMTGVVHDGTLGELLYKPGHPDADEDGYVRTSNVNPLIDMSDAGLSAKAYEASLAVITIAKSMAQKAIEIGR